MLDESGNAAIAAGTSADSLPGTPSESAAVGAGTTQVSDASVAAEQPNASQGTQPDPEFSKETVVKDYKSWQRLNQTLADITGKDFSEIKTLPFENRLALLEPFVGLQSRLSESETKLAEYQANQPFGIIVDAPASQMDWGKALEALPDAYQSGLKNHVAQAIVPTMIQEAISDPQAHPQQFEVIRSSVANLLQTAYGMPVDDLDKLVQAYHSGQLGQSSQAQAAPVHGQIPFYQQLLNEGYESNHALVQSAYADYQRQAQVQQQVSAMQNQLKEYAGQASQLSTSQQQQQQQKIEADFNALQDTAWQKVLQPIAEKVPKGEEWRVEFIEAAARRAVETDPTVRGHLEKARQFMADGAVPLAQRTLAAYNAKIAIEVGKAAKRLTADIAEKEHLKQQVDQRQAGVRNLPAGGAVVSPNGGMMTLPSSHDVDATKRYALELARQKGLI